MILVMAVSVFLSELFRTDVRVSQRMDSNNFNDPLTFL